MVLLFCMTIARSGEAQYVIVTNNRSTIDSLTINQVQKVFKGQPINKVNVQTLQIVEFDPACDAFYQQLYGLNSYSLAKHWLRLIFAGERVYPPKNFTNLVEFNDFIEKNQNAIGFLPRSAYEEVKNSAHLRAVVIDGKNYLDPAYPLREAKKKK